MSKTPNQRQLKNDNNRSEAGKISLMGERIYEGNEGKKEERNTGK
jgi:hypothetical protein